MHLLKNNLRSTKSYLSQRRPSPKVLKPLSTHRIFLLHHQDGIPLELPPQRRLRTWFLLILLIISLYSNMIIISGNNVVAYKSSTSSTTSQSSSGLVFNYTYKDTLAPATTENLNAARVNAFYVINAVHDFTYRYGFTETAYNFQSNNFGKGGAQNDRVQISVQDSSGTNNANFATPAEYVLYLNAYTLPRRFIPVYLPIVVNLEHAVCTSGRTPL